VGAIISENYELIGMDDKRNTRDQDGGSDIAKTPSDAKTTILVLQNWCFAIISVLRSALFRQQHCAITQPDHETSEQRIRAPFAPTICERFSPRARQRNSQLKFFKPYRGFADSLGEIKNHRKTITYGWRSKRYSNCRSVLRSFPFEMSAEFPAKRPEMEDRENFPQELPAR
jgi:hypothetical protein